MQYNDPWILILQIYVCMGKEVGIHSLIYEALLRNLHLAEKVFVPIMHTNKAHFNLFYMDLNDAQWYHLNPYIKAWSLAGDEYFQEAKKMVHNQSFLYIASTRLGNLIYWQKNSFLHSMLQYKSFSMMLKRTTHQY